eukprot:6064930-Pyramimonas_sp.AAC.1
MAALGAKQDDQVQTMLVVCPELGEAAKPPPPKAPQVLLGQYAAEVRKLHTAHGELKNQLVANAKHGKELLEKLGENVRACAEAQAE